MKRLAFSISTLSLFLAADIAGAQNLVLHNTLGSASEILSSVVGPPLTFGSRPIAYVGAPGGSGMTIAASGGGNAPVLLPGLPGLVNPEQGCVECVFQMTALPIAFNSNPFLLFDGDFGAGSGLGLEVWRTYSGTVDLIGFVEFGGARVAALNPAFPTRLGYPAEALARRWLHVALVWDRAGIAGGADTVRLYLNGVIVGSATATSWGTTVGPNAEIGGANDCCPHQKLHYDDVKLWDAAKTTFAPTFNVWFQSPDGPGSVTVSNGGSATGRTAFNVLSIDPANAGLGAGIGPFFGLHVSFADVVTQFLTFSPPFLAPMDAFGGMRFDVPAGGLPSGLAIYAVALDFHPDFTIAGVSPVIAHLIP